MLFLYAITLLGVGCFAQESQTIGPPDTVSAPSQQVGQRSISIVRLHVPRKARELYENKKNVSEAEMH